MILDELGLRRMINAGGKLSALGASAVSDGVAAALADASRAYVDMDELQARAGEVVARATGAEAGMVCACAAAGIAIAVGACIAGDDPAAVESLPDFPGPRREVVIQKGHVIHFGAPLVQMMRLGGARVVEIGSVSQVDRSHLSSALGPHTAAALFVVSHHTAQVGQLTLDAVIDTAHRAGVPVIVDAAAEVDLRAWVSAGADLVVYSGHKAIGGPTSGLIAGRRPLVTACLAQSRGIGRAMKAGKEAIVGLLAALAEYAANESEDLARATRRAEEIAAGLQGLPGLAVTLAQDETRPIRRVRVNVDPARAGLTAAQLAAALEAGDPCIKTRNHHLAQGVLHLDPRPLRPGEPAIVVARIREVLAGVSRRTPA